MIAEVDDERVVRLTALFERGEQLPHAGVEAGKRVVVVGDHLTHRGRVDAQVRHRFDLCAGLRRLRQAVHLSQPRVVRVG